MLCGDEAPRSPPVGVCVCRVPPKASSADAPVANSQRSHTEKKAHPNRFRIYYARFYSRVVNFFITQKSRAFYHALVLYPEQVSGLLAPV